MYQRILVPVDGSATSNQGLDEAIAIAKLTGARIRLVHVVDEMPALMAGEGFAALAGDVLGVLREAGQQILADAQRRVEGAGVPVESALFDSLQGRLAELVAQEIEAWKADLVVLGTHGRRGVRRLVLGSDAELIVRTASVPVLLVRERAAPAG